MPRAVPTAPPEDLATPDTPQPSNSPRNRRRRFGWTVLGVALLVGITPAYWWLSAVTSGRALRQAIDLRRQRGEPVLASDFPAANLPADRNAATYLRRAAASIQLPPGAAPRVGSGLGPPPWPQEVLDLFRDVIPKNASALADVRRAREFPAADWGMPLTAQFWTGQKEVPRSYVNDMLQLAQFLADVAVYEHQAGDDAGAVETTRDLLAMARAIDGKNGLVSHLSAFRATECASAAALGIAPRLSVAGRPTSQPSGAGEAGATAKPAGDAQVRALIADLLDDKSRRDAITASWLTERAARLEEFRRLGQQGLRMRGVADRAAIYELDLHDVTVSAALAPDWPAAEAVLTRAPALPPRGPERILAQSSLLVARNTTMSENVILTERRAAALALAIRLSQLDHDGERPATLAELVPSYLDAVPLDPYAAGGRPFRYTQYASDRDGITPAVYSIAEDGKDDAGDGMTLRAGVTQRSSAGLRWFTRDSVYRLDPRPPPPPAEKADESAPEPSARRTPAPTTTSSTSPE